MRPYTWDVAPTIDMTNTLNTTANVGAGLCARPRTKKGPECNTQMHCQTRSIVHDVVRKRAHPDAPLHTERRAHD